MPMTASGPASTMRHDASSTSAAIRESAPPTSSSPSRPSRSRAAMRSSSSRFHRRRCSTSASSTGRRSPRSDSTSRAVTSEAHRSVSERLAPHTTTTAARTRSSPSSRSRRPAWVSTSRSTAAVTASGAAECPIASRSEPIRTRKLLQAASRTLLFVPPIRVAACQLNPVVGDLAGNVERVLERLEEAEAQGCDLAVFSELVVTGYPPEDLLLKPRFVAENMEAVEKIAARTGLCAAIVGFAEAGRDLSNAAAVCADGKIVGTYHKRLLPNYGVFDEKRYFAPGDEPFELFRVAGVRVGVSICEDAWSPSGPVAEQAAGGAELVVNINASPFHAGRLIERLRMLATRASDASCAIVYVNQVGGQDE